MTVETSLPGQRRGPIAVIAIFIVGCIGVTTIIGLAGYRAEVLRADATQMTYDAGLRQLGIEPNLAGVEHYLLQTIQPGEMVDDVISKLEPLGVVTRANSITRLGMPGCSSVSIWLERMPGKTTSFIPPSTPPIFQIDVCELDGVLNWVGDLSRVDNR